MLVLRRKVNETIHIGGGVVITIIAVAGKAVKVGIEAGDQRILRGEHIMHGGDPSVPYCKSDKKP